MQATKRAGRVRLESAMLGDPSDSYEGRMEGLTHSILTNLEVSLIALSVWLEKLSS